MASPPYNGTQPVPGLTNRQRASLEAMCKGVEPALHDGILRCVYAALPGSAPWTHNAFITAVCATFSENGLPLPFLPLAFIGRDEATNLQGAGRLTATATVSTP
jgi:hypothetical protein